MKEFSPSDKFRGYREVRTGFMILSIQVSAEDYYTKENVEIEGEYKIPSEVSSWVFESLETAADYKDKVFFYDNKVLVMRDIKASLEIEKRKEQYIPWIY